MATVDEETGMNKNLRLLVNIVGNDKLSGSLRNIVGLGETASKKLAVMKQGARDLDKELRGVQREIGNTSGNVTDLLDRERDLEKRIAKTNREMERQVDLLKVQASVEKIKARGEDIKSAGTSNMMGAAAAAAPILFMAKSAMDYEKKLGLLAQKTDMSAASTKEFGRFLISTAKATSQSTDAMLEAADFLGGKGIESGPMAAMLPAIGKFATAWDANVVDASKAAYAGYLSLKVPLSQTARSLEIMAVAGKAGGFEVKDMAQYFPKLTSSFSTFGATGLTAVADLSAALQVLEAKTGDGASAANNLDNLLGFVKSKEGIKNFAKFGIDMPAALKKAEAEGRSPLETIISLLDQATKGDTSKIPLLIGDRQAGAAAVALIAEQERYRTIKGEALKTLGMTEKEYNRMSKTSAANLTAMQTSLTALGLSLGTHVLPILTQGANAVTNLINRIDAWATANPQTASTIMSLATGLIGFKFGLGAVQYAVGSLFGPFATLWGWWKKFKIMKEAGQFAGLAGNIRKVGGSLASAGKWALAAGKNFIIAGAQYAGMAARFVFGAIGKAASVFLSVGRAALVMGSGFMKAGIMMMLSPIGLIIMGVVAALGLAGYLIYKNWDAISSAFATGVQKVKSWLSDLPDWLKTLGLNMMQGLLAMLSPSVLANRLTEIAKRGVTAFKDYFGIKSPSRLMIGMGGFLTQGLANGIDDGGRAPVRAAKAMAASVAAASFAPALALGATSPPPAQAAALSLSGSAPSTASGAGSASAAAPTTTAVYNITVNGGAGTAQDIADQVRAAIEQIERERRGRGFGDN